jgi:hypothetical protein
VKVFLSVHFVGRIIVIDKKKDFNPTLFQGRVYCFNVQHLSAEVNGDHSKRKDNEYRVVSDLMKIMEDQPVVCISASYGKGEHGEYWIIDRVKTR